jgi:hypothetical protein
LSNGPVFERFGSHFAQTIPKLDKFVRFSNGVNKMAAKTIQKPVKFVRFSNDILVGQTANKAPALFTVSDLITFTPKFASLG